MKDIGIGVKLGSCIFWPSRVVAGMEMSLLRGKCWCFIAGSF
jgi:hypothetical protein